MAEITEIFDQKKLSIFKRYYLEISVIFLALVLGVTVRFVISVNDKFVSYILEDKNKNNIQVEKSIEALNNNTEALREIQTIIKESK